MLKAEVLVLLSDTPGLVLDGRTVASLDAAALYDALAHPDVMGGMRPKLDAARIALRGGVAHVHIGSWNGPDALEALLSGRAGTSIQAITEDAHA